MSPPNRIDMAWDRRRCDEFIGILGLRFFSSDEFLVQITQPGKPPSGRFHPAQHRPDGAVAGYGARPLRTATVVSSCYRAREYNPRIGGGERSRHLAFTAVDFRWRACPPRMCPICSATGADAGSRFLFASAEPL
jgi:hypothetical protein